MTPSPTRATLVQGTQALRSLTCYFPAFGIALLIAILLRPLRGPSISEPIEHHVALIVFFWLVVLLVAVFAMRALLWRPIRALYTAIGDQSRFWRYTYQNLRLNLPYIGLMVFLFALSVFEMGTFLNTLHFLSLVGAYWMFSHLRQPEIDESVDELLRQL